VRSVQPDGALRRAAAVLAAGATLVAAAAAAGAPPRPSAADQPLRDGCQRNNGGILFVTSPEWAYVYRDRTPRLIEGVARDAHPSGEDQPGVHRWFDFGMTLAVDRRYRYLLGGDPSRHTGNFFSSREEGTGTLHPEWETGTLPAFAWPTDGDRVKLWGSWIWDCGHWRNDPANAPAARLVGERTELHPLQAAVVIRHASFRSRRAETQADVFASVNGNAAHAVEECALRLRPISADSYGDQLRACARDPRNFIQPLASSYSFFVPAPPRPSASARLTYRVVRRGRGGGERVRVRPDGIQVTALTAGVRGYARTFYVGWSQPPARLPTRLSVRLDTLRILKVSDPNPREPGQRSQPPDELNLYLDANGHWTLLNDWAPGLAAAHLGQTFQVGRAVEVEVPAGQPLRLWLGGRECDAPSHSVQFGIFVPRIHPCPSNPREFSLNEDSPGVAEAVYRSAAAAVGRPRLRSRGGDGAFEARLTVRQVAR
jgi:hypothetical protein